ncbi:uncharacterized protein PAN0_004d2223 [Moesziomyces antarcticus]|uniref:Uncharacterized protein n=1 Tax=Pseudozyma antarctica TaxID=84753 RepID=A0A081CBG8_PSEA2|nr:uncharacterized protein PAN0_004d2223 [Moesziomyces antarcticus]GAK64014.1 hypothetical protein PAN0_004d2223 [Moesziomyces antarcticus]
MATQAPADLSVWARGLEVLLLTMNQVPLELQERLLDSSAARRAVLDAAFGFPPLFSNEEASTFLAAWINQNASRLLQPDTTSFQPSTSASKHQQTTFGRSRRLTEEATHLCIPAAAANEESAATTDTCTLDVDTSASSATHAARPPSKKKRRVGQSAAAGDASYAASPRTRTRTRYGDGREPIILRGPELSSNDFTCPSVLRSTIGTLKEPIPLNLVVKIRRNNGTHSRKTAFRKMIVDVGDGENMVLRVDKGTNLYGWYGEESELTDGTVVVLWNLETKKAAGSSQLVFFSASSVAKVVSATWMDVLEWHQAMQKRLPQAETKVFDDIPED